MTEKKSTTAEASNNGKKFISPVYNVQAIPLEKIKANDNNTVINLKKVFFIIPPFNSRF